MEINNKLLAMVILALGIFLTLVSLRLSSVIESNSNCMQKSSLLNSNRLVLMLGMFMFASSAAYLLCKINCTGEVKGSASEMMYVGFNLVVGIVVLVLFSIIRNNLDDCSPSLKGIDSMLVNIGIVIGVVSVLISLAVLGKKLHDNKDKLTADNMRNQLAAGRQAVGEKLAAGRQAVGEKIDAGRQAVGEKLASMRGSSPDRIEFRDPFGFDDFDLDDHDPML